MVVLIDEFGAPLTSCLRTPELFVLVNQHLSNFYAVLKENDQAIRFLFITGITKFNKIIIFSELNDLSDISLDEEFGTLLGFTYEEVKTYFDDYLLYSSEIIGIPKDDLLN